jgi:hypothetical protein
MCKTLGWPRISSLQKFDNLNCHNESLPCNEYILIKKLMEKKKKNNKKSKVGEFTLVCDQ